MEFVSSEARIFQGTEGRHQMLLDASLHFAIGQDVWQRIWFGVVKGPRLFADCLLFCGVGPKFGRSCHTFAINVVIPAWKMD
jgi:hypothetical protein